MINDEKDTQDTFTLWKIEINRENTCYKIFVLTLIVRKMFWLYQEFYILYNIYVIRECILVRYIKQNF